MTAAHVVAAPQAQNIQMGLAVMATSMSLIVVFLPVAFMAGIVGRFMFSFGVTMAFAIAVSLLVSFALAPMMAARYLKREDLSHEGSTRERGFYSVIERVYLAMLDWSMAHRWVIISLMLGCFCKGSSENASQPASPLSLRCVLCADVLTRG